MPEFKQISIDLLDSNPWQVRKDLDDDEGLIASIKDSPLKVRNAPLVRPDKTRFQIASGHRRVNAAKKAGEKTIWCKVEKISDLDMKIEVVVENLHRKSLSTVETYNGLEQVRKTLGLEKDFFSELHRKTGLSDEWIRALYDSYRDIIPNVNIQRVGDVEKYEPTVAVVRATSGLSKPDRIKLVERATEKGWGDRNVTAVKLAIKDNTSEKIRTKLIDSDMDVESTVNIAKAIKPLDENVSIKILDINKNTTTEQRIKVAESIQPLTKDAQIKVLESKLPATVMAELSKLKVPETIELVAKEIRVRHLNEDDAIATINRVILNAEPQFTKVKDSTNALLEKIENLSWAFAGFGINEYMILTDNNTTQVNWIKAQDMLLRLELSIKAFRTKAFLKDTKDPLTPDERKRFEELREQKRLIKVQ